MKTIWKFPFKVADIIGISMPAGATILHVEVQGAGPVPCLWALVDPKAPTVRRNIRIFGTGHDIPDEGFLSLCWVATFQQGPFVWHVFDQGETEP